MLPITLASDLRIKPITSNVELKIQPHVNSYYTIKILNSVVFFAMLAPMPAYRGAIPTSGQAEAQIFSLASQCLYPYTPKSPTIQEALPIAKTMLDALDMYSIQHGPLAAVRSGDVTVKKYTFESSRVDITFLTVNGIGRRSQQVRGQHLRIMTLADHYEFSRLQRPTENGLIPFNSLPYGLQTLGTLAETMADEVDYHEDQLGYTLPIGSTLGPQ